MNKKEKKYSIGLDIGTTSVGWAVIDNNSRLIKKGNDPLWGYSLFEEGHDAASRRSARSARRRYTRRKQRIHLLQDLLSEIIYPIDELFFKRLENSYLVPEDRNGYLKEGGILFSDAKSDSKYYSRYPTIYHLRKHLIEVDQKEDPRLIYLALHHITKYRGNFLYEGQNFSLANSESESITSLETILDDIGIDRSYAPQIFFHLSNETATKKDRKKMVSDLGANKETKSILSEIADALLGYKFTPGVIIGIDNDKKTSFADTTYENFMDEFSIEAGEASDIIYELQSIYSTLVLKNILKGSNSISNSMVKIYERHKSDLKELKTILDPYSDIRKHVLNDIYDKYINDTKNNPKDEFYKKLKAELNKVPDSIEKTSILNRMDNGEFLPKQNTTDNGAIPYQLHYLEAKAIIDNQKRYYKCLEENEDKILSIISFRRPYYLGPSKGGDGINEWSWMVTNSNEPLRPWNWKEVVDIEETAKRFIDRMRNHCTYLLEEDTLPKNSIILNRFNLLNELNKIKIDGKPVFTKKIEKLEVINSLFLNKAKVSSKDLLNWLFDNQKIVDKDKVELTGFQSDDGFASALQTERSFRTILGDRFDTHIDDVEKMISYLTVYNDKEIIRRRIKSDTSLELSETELEKITNLKLSGYGRFSKKLIDGLVSNTITKSPNTILGYMYETNDNFMQVLNNAEYGFMEQISTLNYQDNEPLSDKFVKKLATSPANKRAVWQSIRVVKDIIKFMEHDPEAIYLEFAREEGNKKRSTSRFKRLEKIYKEYCDKELQKELNDHKDMVDSERVYLYFVQQGKCMYSGKKLSINELDKYQIDHILPQSYIKDDSLENKALVIASENQRKKDSLLLDSEIIARRKSEWKKLEKQGLIGPKKYRNLTRNKVGELEMKGFIARQLVETRQICVHVRDILKSAYPNTEIGVVHAPISSEFRHKYRLHKIRNLNSAHHAHDAYLAAMIGRFIKTETPYLFTDGSVETRYIKKVISERLNEESKKNGGGAERLIYSIVVHKMGNDVLYDDNGEIYWNGSKQIAYTKKMFGLKKYFFNYQTRDYDGSLYNATIYPANNVHASIRIKNNMPVEKYGGYSSLEKAYAMAVEYKDKKKIKRVVIDIPAMYATNPHEYLVNETGDPEVKALAKLRMNQMFIKDGSLLTMSSASEWSIREPLFLDDINTEILYKISHGKYDLYSFDELFDLFITILKKAYDNIPTLRDVINSKIGGNKNSVLFDNEKSLEYAHSMFDGLSIREMADSITKLIVCITSKSHPPFMIGNHKISDRFGRLTGKNMILDDVEFIFTSPSGLYKTAKKL